MSALLRVPGLGCALVLVAGLLAGRARAQGQSADVATQAHQHYQAGVGLFEAGNKEQALVEFQLANELSPKKENLFMIAQCQYHLGWLKEARSNYQEFLASHSQGELANIARMRIEAINRRPGTIVINSVPDKVQVRIEGEGQVFSGDAPNEFRVPRGHYRVTISKNNFISQERELGIEVAETRPLFFKLDPIPSRLEIRTSPPGATLYVRGNRAQNPYAQNVEPGTYEIYAEAPYHTARNDSVTLEPGQRLQLEFPLMYVQRSGRPELIGFWTGISAVGGAMVMTLLTSTQDKGTSAPPGTLSLVGAGALAGGIGGAVMSTALVPSYIRDNRALFRIGAGWVGDVEGLSLGLALAQNLKGAMLGGMAGLGLGSVAGWWLDDLAPNYGRVTLIQSAAFLGALGGVLAVPAVGFCLRCGPSGDLAGDRIGWGMFAGINLGLLTGLGLAYLPDQRVYGPSWQRIMLIDLATVAGGFVGALVQTCSAHGGNENGCGGLAVGPQMARYALVGSLVGLAAGWVLTLKYDKAGDDSSDRKPAGALPLPGPLPVQTSDGHWQMIPGLVTQGKF